MPDDDKLISKSNQFKNLEEKIQLFKSQHYEVFQEFAALLNDRNDLLEELEKEVRTTGKSYGPFQVYGHQIKIDVNRLYDELGEEGFLRVGGIIETKRVLDIDKRMFETLIGTTLLPNAVVADCRDMTIKYKMPKKVELP